MMRAYKTNRDPKKGIDNNVFLLLDHINRGHYGQSKDYPKQVTKIQVYLAKAVEKVLKWKLTPEKRNALNHYAYHIQQAYHENSLLVPIRGLLDATQRFKEY